MQNTQSEIFIVTCLNQQAFDTLDTGTNCLYGELKAISDTSQWYNAQWAKSGFFVQWVYWVYLSSKNTRPLCNAAMYEQV